MSYFKPFGRKLGVVTLLMACVFAAGWVRGQVVEDLCVLGNGRGQSYHEIDFSRSGITWSYRCTNGRYTWNPGWRVTRTFPRDHVARQFHNPGLSEKIEWRWLGLGFDTGKVHQPEDATDYDEQWTWILIPWWSLVIPLTLLSAWLLLSKPGTRKPSLTSTGFQP